MARYGISYYGASFYGAPILSAFSADPVEATPIGYGDVLLTWNSPGGSWSELRVVRNYLGYPASVDNGDLIYTTPNGTDAGRLQDQGLNTDRWVYYTIFVYDYNESEWLRSGVARVFVPRNYNGATKMLNLLPDIVKSEQLAGFMAIFGYAYDLLRNDVNSMLDLYDTHAVSYDLVPLLMEQFGIPAESELEPEQYRRFLRNAVFFYKTKGTAPCVRGVVTAVTGWQAAVDIGSNLLWTADYSDFVGGIGDWRVKTNATVAWTAPTSTVPGALRQTAPAGSATSEVHLPELIPVTHNVTYSAAAVVAASDLAQSTASIRFDWYDLAGNPLSSSDGTAVATRQGVDTPLHTTVTAPTNAVAADVVLVIHAPTAASWWEWRKVMVNRGGLLPHEPGRDIRIYVNITDTDPLRRQVHLDRLISILPRYLPMGATFTLIEGSLPEPYVSDDTILTTTPTAPATAPVGRTVALRWNVEHVNAAVISLVWNVH